MSFQEQTFPDRHLTLKRLDYKLLINFNGNFLKYAQKNKLLRVSGLEVSTWSLPPRTKLFCLLNYPFYFRSIATHCFYNCDIPLRLLFFSLFALLFLRHYSFPLFSLLSFENLAFNRQNPRFYLTMEIKITMNCTCSSPDVYLPFTQLLCLPLPKICPIGNKDLFLWGQNLS